MLDSMKKLRPRDAARALRALLRNPDDTAQVFRIVEALSAGTPDRVLGRLRQSAAGRKLLAEKPDLLARLLDRDVLSRLPDGTLGREYLRFLDREGVSTEGLRQASIEGRRKDLEVDEDIAFLRNRMRDQHDLWHVVAGYQGDLLGEASLLAFTLAQTRNPGVLLIVAAAWIRGRETDVRRLIGVGFRRGLRAAWFPEQPWEELLSKPVTALRRELGVGDPPVYEPIRSSAYLAANAA